MTETWKNIINYEGKYMVSNLGRVKSIVWRGVKKETLFTPWLNKNGYPMVSLRKNGEKTGYSIHSLVWEAFNGPVPDGLQINHINEDKTDNRLENLNLMTPSENCRWGTRTKRIVKKHKKPVIQMSLAGDEIFGYFSAIDAENELSIAHQSISKCCKNKMATAGGYKWRYA